MEEKELKQLRERSQNITNILEDDFDFKWDGIDYTIEKWNTQSYPYYLAEHAALHMARKYATIKWLNYTKEAGKIVDEIMNKKFIDYDLLTIKQAKELATERKISLETKEGKPKNKATIIADLKKTH